jgi:RHS repeat-associated protein
MQPTAIASFGRASGPTFPAGSFEQNAGQWPSQALYKFRAPGYDAYLTARGFVVALANVTLPEYTDGLSFQESVLVQTNLYVEFMGANGIHEGSELESYSTNYLIGNSSAAWRAGVPSFREVHVHELYPGIDLRYHANSDGTLKYDLLVEPGANPGIIRIQFKGAENLALDLEGNLLIKTAAGTVRHGRPVSWQGSVPVAAAYRLGADNIVRLELGAYDHAKPLVIDPPLYSTYFGGNFAEEGISAHVDPVTGAVTMAGLTSSTTFPLLGAYQSTNRGVRDAFITRFAPDGDAILTSTFLGGSQDETSAYVDLGPGGEVYVAGTTKSTDFPTLAGYQTTKTGTLEAAFITKMDAAASSLTYSTYINAAAGFAHVYSLDIDGNGEAFISGESGAYSDPLYPTTPGSYAPTLPWHYNGFVTKLDASGTSLDYSTYLNCHGDCRPYDIAVDSLGSAYVTANIAGGITVTPGAYHTSPTATYPPYWYGFVMKFNPAGSATEYSTYMEGSPAQNSRSSIAIDMDGYAYITGSLNNNAFLTKLNPTGTGAAFSVSVGGSGTDYANDLVLLSTGSVAIIGNTLSSDFPLAGTPYQQANGGAWDGFAAVLAGSTGALEYSTYLGGTATEEAKAAATDATGVVYVIGDTKSANYPVTEDAYQKTRLGTRDAFVTKVDVFAPAAPSGLTATTGPLLGQITLSWTPGAAPSAYPVRHYVIYRSTVAGGPYAAVGSSTFPSFVDHDLPTGPYYYRVAAVNDRGESTKSGEATAMAAGMPLGTDGFTLADYQSESPTGNTPFAGVRLKSPWPSAATDDATVNLAKGEFVARLPLLQMDNDFGEPLLLQLTYRSIGNAAGHPGLSWGWDCNWFQRIEADGPDYLYHTGDGRVLRYTPTTGGYEGPPGTYSMLVPVAGKMELQGRDGTRLVFNPAISNQLEERVDPAGNSWALVYNPDGSLNRVTDPAGRYMVFAYATAGASAGNPFYTGVPLLLGIADHTGRSVGIQRGVTDGHITSVQTPSDSSGTAYKTKLQYGPGHLLNTFRDPMSYEYLKIGYDGFGRVLSQVQATGAAWFFTYYHDAGITVAWDAASNKEEWRFLPSGAAVPRTVPTAKIDYTSGKRTTDPASYSTTYGFNAQDEMTSIIFPAGNSETHTYDETNPSIFARGNLLSSTTAAGNVRTLRDETTYKASITTRYEYDPIHNVVVRTIDPRGTDGTYAPPNGGVPSAGRYTTRIFYDFEEATLGDLNGDGITSDSDRKPVKISYPTVNAGVTLPPAFTAAYLNQAAVETFQWNDDGQLLRHTGASGIEEARSYFPNGDLKDITIDPSGFGIKTSFTYNSVGDVTGVTDPNGNVQSFDVDGRSRTRMETRSGTTPSPAYMTKQAFDTNDQLIRLERETDTGTNVFTRVEYGYDRLGRTASKTTYADRSTVIEAALAGHPTPPPAVFTDTFEHDGNGNLVRHASGSGETQEWTYDERGLVLQAIGGNGPGSFAYDANGNLATATDANGNSARFQTDGHGRQTVETDATGTAVITTYDVAGNAVSQAAYDGAGGGRKLREVRSSHDERGQVFRIDAEHIVPEGERRSIDAGTLTPGDAWVTTFQEWSKDGKLLRRTDDNGHLTQWTYDAAGRLEVTTGPTGETVRNTYDDNGNTRSVERSDGLGPACPHNCTTLLDYDFEDRPTEQQNPDGTTRQWFYDGRGNVWKTIDENGHETITLYDNADRPWVTRQQPAPSVTVTTTTHWDPEGRAQTRCNGPSTTDCTSYEYVPSTAWVTAETPHPTSGLSGTIHRYDAGGNRIATIYGNGREIHMAYDSVGHVRAIDITADASTIGTLHQSFTYDALGQVIASTDTGVRNMGSGLPSGLPETTATQAYDSFGRVVREAQNGFMVHYVRDGVGNVVETVYPSTAQGMVAIDPTARVILRSYDIRDRVDRVWDAKGLIADYTHEGNRIVRKQLGGPVATLAPKLQSEFQFDAAGRLESLLHKDSAGSVVAGFEPRFDDAGNRVAQRHLPATANLQSQTFTLDAMHRLKEWRRGEIDGAITTIATPAETATWDVDNKNDWNTWTGKTGACTRSTGTTGTTPVREVSDSCVPMTGPATSKTYAYDANGNLRDDGQFLYSWDFKNRLVRVDDEATGKTLVGYGYDAFDRRIVKVYPVEAGGGPLPSAAASTESVYTYAGQHVIQETRPNSATPTAIRILRQWTYGPGIDEALEMSTDSDSDTRLTGVSDARHFYLHDPLGSVAGLLSDSSGKLAEGYTYDAFGGVTIRIPGSGASVAWDATDVLDPAGPSGHPESPGGNSWFFNGRQYDPETQTYHYRARQYHPILGQFISMDPIGVWGDAKNLGNPYAYVSNNPGSMRDPTGMCGQYWNAYVFGCLWDVGTAIGETGIALGEGYMYCEDNGLAACGDALSSNVQQGWNSFSSSVSATSDCFVNGGGRCTDMCSNPNMVSGLACHYDQCNRDSGWSAADCYTSATIDFALVDASLAIPAAQAPAMIERAALSMRASLQAFAASEAAEMALLPRLGVAAEAAGSRALAGVSEKLLSGAQAENLGRFVGKLPKDAGQVSIYDLPSGGKALQSTVPGRVPGSYAIYEKQIDSLGKTLQYTKTTVDHYGNVVHVKDKIGGGMA